MELQAICGTPEIENVLKIMLTGIMAFCLAFLITPIWTHFLYKYKLGIKIKKKSVQGDSLQFVNTLHADKAGTPTMGGVIVWFSIFIFILASHYIFPLIAWLMDINFLARMDFLSRSQTWLPLFALIATGILGLFDDVMSVRGWGSNKGGGMRFAVRFWWLFGIAALGAWWFYSKLGWDVMHIPAVGDFSIGLWYIPLFIFVIIFTAFSSNETDGLDGLNGGILMMAFSAFALIAFTQNKVDLAAFCLAISGALLAFLWFNVYPARFFMGDTGAISLGATLGVVAMLTNSVVILFIIVFVYVLESGSAFIQITSKKFFKRKVFLAAPIHHHFEALGWPEPKITMRAWIFTAVMVSLGLIIGIIGMG
ncbi:MAG: phospho-N-acetylmuramoyl-pentapeptide-transferase [Candidatus Moraniibacteriota bacterium]|jgi:phospho-N-acetylmuramoyl-pentapeptide-transferase